MSLEDFNKFRTLVIEQPKLQEELSPIEDLDVFVTRVVEMARGRQLAVEPEDIREAMSEARKNWIERWI